MDRAQIQLIRSSAQSLADGDIMATNLFYSNLFSAAPSLRALFPQDMFTQSEKLWASIVAVVDSIDHIEDLRPTLEMMGRRHVTYGAEAGHYAVVHQVMIETISSLLIKEWTSAHQEAWDIALTFVCASMLDGANAAAA